MKGRQRGMATKTDINKQGWQSSDFPVACQKCYGENPYMRMLKENYGQQCRICFRPFTVFKWKGDRGIYKRTCLCNNCSKVKNLCQVCTLDLEFGLPMQVRDKRCGQNGKFLLNENFVNETSKRERPPPPSTPPPVPKNVYEQKQAVFIPSKEESDSQVQPEKDEQKKQEQESKHIEKKEDSALSQKNKQFGVEREQQKPQQQGVVQGEQKTKQHDLQKATRL